MAELRFEARGESPQGKPRVYFSCYPEDFEPFFPALSAEILKISDCVVFYYDPDVHITADEVKVNLGQMQLFVMPVTGRLLSRPSRALRVEIPFAVKHHIPVLPIMVEEGLAEQFDQICGSLQFLDRVSADPTAIPYEEKLKKYLQSVLISDELADRVRKAFDAYIFLSYRKIDREYAQRLMRLIHQIKFCRDIAIWYDEFLVPGENFNSAINDALLKSRLFALAVTPNVLKPNLHNEANYVMKEEYPRAIREGKPIVALEMQPTDQAALRDNYKNIPDCTNPNDDQALSAAITSALEGLALLENDSDPSHNFLIGLAYLDGIDVEVDRDRARKLITGAAEAGLPEAMEKLVAMYRAGEGVDRDYRAAIRWQEILVYARRALYKAGPSKDSGLLWFTALWDLSLFWHELGQAAQAGQVCDDMLETGQTLDAAYHADWTQSLLSIAYGTLGDVCRAKGALAKAKAFHEKALAIDERLAAKTGTKEARLNLSISYNKLGDICQKLDDLAGARAYYEKGFAVNDRLGSETGAAEARRELSVSYDNLGDICQELGDLAGAKANYEKAVAIDERLVAKTDTAQARRDLAVGYSKLGSISQAQGDLAGAKAYCEKALDIRERLRSEADTVKAWRELSISYGKLGDICRELGDPAGAKDFYEKSLAICERLGAQTDAAEARRDLAFCYNELGDICQELEDLAEAKTFYEKALAIDEQLVAKTGAVEARQDLAVCYTNLGDICQELEDLAKAREFFEKGLVIRERLRAEVDTVQTLRDLSVSYSRLGGVCQELGDLAEAKEFYEKALAIDEQLVAKTGAVEARRDLSIGYNELGDICREQGDLAGARAFYEKSLTVTERLAAESESAKVRDDLARSYYHLASITRGEERQGYLRKAEAIWSRLAAQCPDVPLYKENLAVVRKYIR